MALPEKKGVRDEALFNKLQMETNDFSAAVAVRTDLLPPILKRGNVSNDTTAITPQTAFNLDSSVFTQFELSEMMLWRIELDMSSRRDMYYLCHPR